MNFGHMVGQQHFENQWLGMIHTFVSWTPVIIAIIAGMVASIVYRPKILQFVTQRIQKQR